MYHKQTLGAAIAMALSLGVSSTEAATFTTCLTQSHSVLGSSLSQSTALNCTTATPTYAYEQFGSSVNLSYPFRVRYTPTGTIGTNYDFYVTFSLNNGATTNNVTWGSKVQSVNLRFEDTTGTPISTATAPKISIVGKGETTDSTVSFLVNSQKTAGVTTAQVLDFEFLVGNANNVLKNAGGTITLSVDLRAAQTADPTSTTNKVADTALSVPIAQSAEGADITLEAPTDGTKAYISILSDGKNFEGSGAKTATQVYYGNIKIGAKTSNAPLDYTATSLSGSWDPSIKLAKGSLIIDNGNFNASGAASAGKVYIAKGDGTSLVAATSFSSDGTTAKWEFKDSTSLKSIYDGTNSGNGVIVLNVDGSTAITENRKVAPKGTLYVEYTGGTGITRTSNLRHLKKNGSVCTVYNIPPSDALDVVNLRITNDSNTASGFVKGTLRGMDGVEIFKGKMLVDTAKPIAPHGTVHLSIDDLTAGGSAWKQRAVLTLESNIPEPNMQVFALLRAKGTKEGFPESPLMNMSTGATGSGCD